MVAFMPRRGPGRVSPGARLAKLDGLSPGTLQALESVGLLLHIGVMLAFTIIIVYSKHLHIFVAPINVSANGCPRALGPLEPIRYEGKLIDFEDPPEDADFGAARSSSSPGRECSTSPPAPSAAANRSARRGTPASRSPRSW